MSWSRLLVTWALLAVLMSLNGIFRELVLRNALGRGAPIASALLGAVIILVTTGAMLRSTGSVAVARLIPMSVALVLLTVAFEFAMGMGIDRKPVSELLANYAFWRGALWPWLLLLVALTPFLWGRWFPSEVHHAR